MKNRLEERKECGIDDYAKYDADELLAVIVSQERNIKRHKELLDIIKVFHTKLFEPERYDLIGSVLEMIYRQISCNEISVIRLDTKGQHATVECSITDGVINRNNTEAMPVNMFYNMDLPDRKFIYIKNINTENFTDMRWLSPFYNGFSSCLLIPIVIKRNFIGIVILTSSEEDFFSEEDIDYSVEVVSTLAVIVYQQRVSEKNNKINRIVKKEGYISGRKINEISDIQDTILENSDTGILFINKSGKVALLNSAFETIFGITSAEIIGQDGKVIFDTVDIDIPSFEDGDTSMNCDSILDCIDKFGYFQGKGTLIDKFDNFKHILLSITALNGGQAERIGIIVFVFDITRIKAVENEIKSRTRLLTSFFDSASALHCIVNMNGYFVLLNPLWEEVLGYTLSELMAKPFFEFLHPDDRRETLKAFDVWQVGLERKPNAKMINRYRHKNGKYRIFQWTSSELDDILVCSAIDITEQLRMQNKIRRVNQRLKLATKAAQQGIWEYDVLNDRFRWSRQTRKIYGISEEGIAKSFRFADLINLIHPLDRATLILDYQALDTFRSFTRITRIVHPDKSIRHVETHGLILRDELDRPVKAVGIAQDVTARVQAQEAVRESEERFRQIADNVDEGFFLFKLTPFSIIYANNAFERICGLPSAAINEIDGKRFDIVIPEDRDKAIAFMNELSEKKGGETEFRIGASADAYLWVLLRVFEHLEEGSERRFVGLLRDITTQKEKEILLLESLNREKELSLQKTQFVSTVSHEFRTPLMTIQSSVDIIRYMTAKLKASEKKVVDDHLDKIQTQVFNFSGLLSDLLSLGKAESGKTIIQLNNISLDDLCSEVIRLNFSDRRDKRFVDYSVLGVPFKLALDKSLISRVIINLLSNAFKFSRTNPSLVLDFRECSQVIITIRDEGIGIPQKDQEALFQTFYRASNVSTIQGTGLGLVIARQLVELHNGQVTVESQEGKGTTCTVNLPVRKI